MVVISIDGVDGAGKTTAAALLGKGQGSGNSAVLFRMAEEHKAQRLAGQKDDQGFERNIQVHIAQVLQVRADHCSKTILELRFLYNIQPQKR